MSPGPRTLAVTFPTLSSTPGVANRRRRSVVFREHNTGPPGPSGHGGPRLRSEAWRAFVRRHEWRQAREIRWCFREHNTGPPGPSGHGGPRLPSFAAVQHSPRDAFRRRHIARRELAVQHEAAQLVFDNADPWPRLVVEDTHEVIAGQGAFGAQLCR